MWTQSGRDMEELHDSFRVEQFYLWNNCNRLITLNHIIGISLILILNNYGKQV